VVLAIGVLYLTIWPHELGHSALAYLYGCKSNWWQTDMSWYLWDSWSGPIDDDCLLARSGAARGLTAFAGIGVNFLLLGLAPLIGRWWHSDAPKGSPGAWVFVGTVLWALANYSEAYSYLIVNTLWLSSDMETVVLESGVSRSVWCGLGVATAILLWRMLIAPLRSAAALLESPRTSGRTWLVILVIYVVVISLAMGAARITLVPPRSR
jgi:hypothetical protein